jgi:DNA-binding IclR family transcriptional regulator
MIHSVLKAIDVMLVFTRSEPRLSLAEISRRLDLPKSTVHNLLATLMERNLIEKLEGDAYALGSGVITLSQAVRVNVEVRDRAAPLLRELANTCRESVYLTVLDHDHALYIYAIESPHRLLARTAIGGRSLLHCTAVGKAMLSALPDERVRELFGSMTLPAYTETTITDFDQLMRELNETRKRGYSIDRGEHEPGTYCVGAPIYDAQGRVIAGCSISGADPEIIGNRRDELARYLLHTAQEISRRMGYVPNTPSLVIPPVQVGNGKP